MKAIVLGIGTELTQGQIINKNASWISQKLKALGLITEAHFVVPDDRNLIQKTLNFIENLSTTSDETLLFVTGGLGPTSDDFTRDLIAEWTGTSLEFHEASWHHVVKALESRGMTAKEIQKQQCYFPTSSFVLENSAGTANAFYIEHQKIHVFVLPGPPREIEAIWKDHLQNWLVEKTTSLNVDPHLTLIWDTMGWPESEVATITESVLKNIPNIDIGYRVHLPYVEVKVSFFKSQLASLEEKISELELALSAVTIAKNGEDVVSKLSDILLKHNYRLLIQDSISKYYLLNRCLPEFKNKGISILWDNSSKENFSQIQDSQSKDLMMVLTKIDEHSCRCKIQIGHFTQELNLQSPYQVATMKERSQQYLSEKALLLLYKLLSQRHIVQN